MGSLTRRLPDSQAKDAQQLASSRERELQRKLQRAEQQAAQQAQQAEAARTAHSQAVAEAGAQRARQQAAMAEREQTFNEKSTIPSIPTPAPPITGR